MIGLLLLVSVIIYPPLLGVYVIAFCLGFLAFTGVTKKEILDSLSYRDVVDEPQWKLDMQEPELGDK